MICPYCKQEAKWCENKERYGKNYGESYMCYWCKDCDAYVGCHNNSKRPLGTMANAELRKWRIRTHNYIDQFHGGKGKSRSAVYRKLGEHFGKEIHIGESDIDMCKRILEVKLDKGTIPKPNV